MLTDDEIQNGREDFAIQASNITMNLTEIFEKVIKIEQLISPATNNEFYKPLSLGNEPPKKRVRLEK
jgi:hypothetical protein